MTLIKSGFQLGFYFLTLVYQITENEQGTSILNYLKKLEISKKAIVATKHRGGDLCVNGQHQTVRYCLQAGDELKIIFLFYKFIIT